jgi:hypothetical protein
MVAITLGAAGMAVDTGDLVGMAMVIGAGATGVIQDLVTHPPVHLIEITIMYVLHLLVPELRVLMTAQV